MPLAEDPARRLPHRGESRHEQIVKRLAGGEFLPERPGPRGEFGIGELLHLGLKRVDRRDFRPVALETAIVRGAENLFRDGAQHFETTLSGRTTGALYPLGAARYDPSPSVRICTVASRICLHGSFDFKGTEFRAPDCNLISRLPSKSQSSREDRASHSRKARAAAR